jgi:hypothetical protein
LIPRFSSTLSFFFDWECEPTTTKLLHCMRMRASTLRWKSFCFKSSFLSGFLGVQCSARNSMALIVVYFIQSSPFATQWAGRSKTAYQNDTRCRRNCCSDGVGNHTKINRFGYKQPIRNVRIEMNWLLSGWMARLLRSSCSDKEEKIIQSEYIAIGSTCGHRAFSSWVRLGGLEIIVVHNISLYSFGYNNMIHTV